MSSNVKTVVETKRLHLRPLTDGDEENLLKIVADPITMRYYDPRDGREKLWITNAKAAYQKKKIGFFACFLKESEEFAGVCGLLEQPNVEGKDEIEVGYVFVRKYWGHGYATEAAKACMDYGFNTLGLSRIISLIDPANGASIRVAEKNGLIKEGKTTFKGRPVSLYSIND